MEFVFDNRVDLNLQIMSTGTSNVHYWNGPPTWRGPFGTAIWNYKIICCGGKAPVIANTGVPTINAGYSIDLSSATANARAMFVIGIGRTAIDLSIIGATGCTLYTDPLVILGLTTNSTGTGSMRLSVPNDPTLVGFVFHTQYAIDDSRANNAGLLFTAGAENRVGR